MLKKCVVMFNYMVCICTWWYDMPCLAVDGLPDLQHYPKLDMFRRKKGHRNSLNLSGVQ